MISSSEIDSDNSEFQFFLIAVNMIINQIVSANIDNDTLLNQYNL